MQGVVTYNMYNPVRFELFHVWLKGASMKNKRKLVLEHVRNSFSRQGGEFTVKFQQLTRLLCSKLQERWVKCKRQLDVFEKTNQVWLANHVFSEQRNIPLKSTVKKAFNDLTVRNQRRRVVDLRKKGSSSELSFAAQMNARSEGREDAAKLLSEAMQTTPTRSGKIRKAWKDKKVTDSKPIRKLTEIEALNFYIEGNYSKSMWIQLRQNNIICNAPQIYPSYPKLMKARDECFPSQEHITISELKTEVELQALLDHTARRIVKLQKDVLATLSPSERMDLELVTKHGLDGSSGHSNYKQKLPNNSDDSAILMVSVVPVQLRVKSSPEKIVWHNIRPSSTRYCRPVKMIFEKETTELTEQELKSMNDQIANLEATIAIIDSATTVSISHTMVCSMIDGKVMSAISKVSCQRCSVCGASPKEFNNLNKVRKKTPNHNMYKFGLSPLHAHIR